jgi:hypothetical protein
MTKMITANEARAKSAKSEGLAEMFEEIFVEIEKAASIGLYRATYSPKEQIVKAMYLEATRVLSDLGYRVAYAPNLNCLIIRW